ncbi:hypothetical protein TTHERM_00283650 (macronuclear) [Tetrahymena thermophila SB210]|uniref:Uncharacterized protein n=1 Tax=Tetrahymena thermophila (strain SB210) TaxID=312017 RepID=I7M8F4_TETTS|nr:hypothetical protein TTHERM_00283650 [Tetrahymena thermophila SB210]EAR97976.1 hypothetical protein TTHERM_00283650 [Tetrahymena thermophila SB210]|eukprot:XP_001018221.1 hypothetical protein TTHERM_00283650 [Tetrahymena thermophila SB210]
MIKDLLKGSINHKHEDIEQKYLSKLPKEQQQPKIVIHQHLDEELKPLTMINQSVSQLNGVKGVYIREIFMLSNMFSWNTSNVFEIHEADSSGKRLDPNSQPILYAVAKLQECCTCDCSVMGTSQIAITTKLDDVSSNTPYLFLKEKNVCCGFNTCDIFINEKGNGTLIGNIKEGCRNALYVNSSYLNNLSFYLPLCQCQCNQSSYQVQDAENNKGILNLKLNCCDCNNPYTYEAGFPPKYDTDQNTLYLAAVIYLGYINYQSRQKSNNSSSSSRHK